MKDEIKKLIETGSTVKEILLEAGKTLAENIQHYQKDIDGLKGTASPLSKEGWAKMKKSFGNKYSIVRPEKDSIVELIYDKKGLIGMYNYTTQSIIKNK